MERKLNGTWPRTLWKLVTNPTVDVVAMIALVLIAAWVVVLTDVEVRKAFPLSFVHVLHGR